MSVSRKIVKLDAVVISCVAVSRILVVLVLLCGDKGASRELSPFECGFVSVSGGRERFSIQFFRVSLVFLVFDVELVLLFPYLFAGEEGRALASGALCGAFFVALSVRAVYE